MTGIGWLWVALGCFGLGMVSGALWKGTAGARAWAGLSAAGSVGLLLAGALSFDHPGGTLTIPSLLPLVGVHLGTGPLTGWFLLILGVTGLAISLYSAGYCARPGNGGPVMGGLFPLTLAGLALVVVARDAITLLVAWEIMAVASYILVTLGHDEGAPAGGLLMMILSEFGTVIFLAAFIILRLHATSWSFVAMAHAASGMPLSLRGLIFFLGFLGFGVKAGLVPLQIWLPAAHPVAPSNVSALLSSAIVSMGAYGIIRIADLLGPLPEVWGAIVVSVGAVTALLGILYALMESDMKRMLAFSTIENMGIAMTAFGCAIIFKGAGLAALAGLALAACLLHLLNHAAYKSLLFMGAGSIQAQARNRNMDLMGGLAKTAPYLGIAWLIGTLGIAAVPPFNGFVSEWLVLMTLLQSFALKIVWVRVVLITAGALLALTAGLAVTTFVRAYALSFLGAPRARTSAPVRDPRGFERWGWGLAAVAVLFLGMLPTALVPWLGQAAAPLAGVNVAGAITPPVFLDPGAFHLQVSLGGLALRWLLPVKSAIIAPVNPNFSDIASTYMWVALPAFMLLGWVIRRLMAAGQARAVVREAPTWTGGSAEFEPSMQYTPTAYSVPERNLFATVYGARSATSWEGHDPNFPSRVTYEWSIVPFIEAYLYQPLIRGVLRTAQRVRGLQSGSINAYVLYILIALVLVLAIR